MRKGSMKDQEKKENLKVSKKGKNEKLGMVIWAIIFIVIFYQVIRLAMYTLGKIDKEKMWLYNGVNKIISIVADNSKKDIIEEYNLKYAGIGDVYLTSDTIQASKSASEYDFSKGIDKISEELKKYDVVTASLNTPVANKNLGYSSKILYNAPVELLDALRILNVSNVATATSHIGDKKASGIEDTIKNLDLKELKFTGISSDKRSIPLIINKNEIKIGLLSYTTNKKANKNVKDKEFINVLNEKNLKEDIEFLKNQNVDYIISYLDFESQDSLIVNGIQKENVEMLFDKGVNVVLGTGIMGIQEEIEDEIKIKDKNNHIYAIYSLGEFMGSYTSSEEEFSAIANIEFTKKITKDKKGKIKDIQTNMIIKKPSITWTLVDNKFKKKIYLLDNAIDEYNAGKLDISAKQYDVIKEKQNIINKMFQ
ncbi:MAG: CapA family protein [Clostridia bacterium]